VPGLGFDYPHLAAISENFPFNPPVEGVERGARVSLRQYSSAEIPTSLVSSTPRATNSSSKQPQIIVISNPRLSP